MTLALGKSDGMPASPLVAWLATRVHRETGGAEVHAAAVQPAARLAVPGASDVAFDEGRRVERVVHRRRPQRHDRMVHLRVVEARQRPEDGVVRLTPGRVLERPAQRGERLVVDARDRLPGRQALFVPDQLVVVVLSRHGADVRQRIEVQDVDAGLVEPVRGNPPEHAAVGEASGGVGRRARRRTAADP